MTLATDLATLSTDRGLMHSIIHGDVNTTVTTDGGVVPSLAKILASIGAGVSRGNWTTTTAYALNDIVINGGLTYRCVTAHTSGTFATDLAASKWTIQPTDGASIPVTATGTSTARTLAARFADRLNVLDFGADATGTVDSSTAIQNAINAAITAKGSRVYIPPGTYKIATTLVISSPEVIVEGAGADTDHDITYTTTGTILKWTGSAGGIMLQVYTPVGSSNPDVARIEVRGLKFDCNSSAATAIDARSIANSIFENLTIFNPTTQGMYLAAQTAAEVLSLRRCIFRNISIRCVEAATGIGMVLDGITGGNVCFCLFEGLMIKHKNGVGLKLLDADNNVFLSTYLFKTAAGTAFGLELHGGASTAVRARSNHFLHLSANGGVKAYGTTTYAQPSTSNNIYFYDRENGCPDPTLETGALLCLHNDNGRFFQLKAIQSAFGDNGTNADLARSRLNTESLHIVNGSDDHVRYSDVAGTNIWRLLVQAASGDLMLTRAAGSGLLNLGGGSDLKMGALHYTFGASAPSTGTWAKGDRCIQNNPAVGSPKGWICTVAGSPGTWVSEGNL